MTTLVLVDDHKLFAQGVARLLESDSEFSVLAVLDNGKALLHLLESQSPDVVLMDLNMPQMDGLETMRQMRAAGYKSKIIVLSMYAEEEMIKRCQEAGIDGYLLKDAEPDELIYTIKEVVSGEYQLHFSHIVRQAELPIYSEASKHFVNKFKLTKREFEIIGLVKEGLTNQEMADKLFLSVHTIQTHRKNILAKMQVNNTAELIGLFVESLKA